MRLPDLLLILGLSLTITSCQGGQPTATLPDVVEETVPLSAPVDGGGSFGDEPVPELPLDGFDEGQRSVTGLLNGNFGLNGSATTPAGYLPSPNSIPQAATTGELALVRLRATASDATTNRTLYSDLRGPGGAYSSMTFLSNYVSQYKALYVQRNEVLSMRVHNRPSYSGTLNPPAADVDYTFETKPIEDSSEPNDDENPASYTDRALGKALGLGSTATRSFFKYSESTKDLEDWYATTLTVDGQYRYRLTSYNPRYGTWGYTLKLFNSDGLQIGPTSTIGIGNAAGNLATPVIPASGTYYLQVTGNPSTKTFGSNVFFSLYSVNACQAAVAGIPVFTPSNGNGPERCVGTTGYWSANVLPAAASYSWNFGAGCSPSTSTHIEPSITIAARGTFTGKLTTTTSCGATYTRSFTYSTGCGWTRTIGTHLSRNGMPPIASLNRVAVDAQNRVHLVGTYSGTDLLCTAQEPAGTRQLLTPTGTSALVYLVLNSDGSLNKAVNLVEGNVTCNGLVVATDGSVRIFGHFSGTGLDFDPGPGTKLLSSVGSTDGFCMSLTSTGELGWAVSWGGTGAETTDGAIVRPAGQTLLVGSFSTQADFDPGPAVRNVSSKGMTDAYWLKLDIDGALDYIDTFGGTDADVVLDIARTIDSDYVLCGNFRGTCDFDPDTTVVNGTSAGGSDAFCLSLDFSSNVNWLRTWGSTGGDSANSVAVSPSGQVATTGTFRGTVNFGPALKTSASPSYVDAFLLGINSETGSPLWVQTWGGTTAEEAVELVASPVDGALNVWGTFTESVDLNPTEGALNRTSAGGRDLYLSQFSTSGVWLGANTWGTSAEEFAMGLGVRSDGLPLPVGSFGAAMDFNPGAGTSTISLRGTRDGFVMRLSPNGSY